MQIEQIVDVKTAALFLDAKWPDWYMGIDAIGSFNMDICGECVLLNRARDGNEKLDLKDAYANVFEGLLGFRPFQKEEVTERQRELLELFGQFKYDDDNKYMMEIGALNTQWRREILDRYRAESLV